MRQILFAGADHLAHDRHRVIVGAEAADRHRLAVLDLGHGLFDRFDNLFPLLAHVLPSLLNVGIQDFKIVQP